MAKASLETGNTAERERAALIETALSAKGWHLRFPPALETQFEQATGPERTRRFVWYGFFGLGLSCLFLFNYFTLLPDVAWRAVLIEFAFTTPVVLALMAYMRAGPSPFRREMAEAAAIIASLLAGMASYQGSAYPAAIFFRYCPILTLVFLNVVVAVRFRFAVAASALVVLCNVIDLRLFDSVDSDVKGLVTSSVVFACGLTLMANYRSEKDARRTYLLNEREWLRRDEMSRIAEQRAQERERVVVAMAAHAMEMRDAHRVAHIGTWRRGLADGTLAFSDELHQLLGTDPRTFVPTHENLLSLVHPDDRALTADALARAAAGEGAVEHEWRVQRADGSVAWLWAETHTETDAAGRAVAVRGVCQDVTEHRATAERIYRLAHHDALTGLANRSLLQERLAEALARARRTNGALAVLCLDLDGFKAVNDLRGHPAGDQLLREVAARLSRCVRETDTVARLGGDEFVVLQTDHVHPGMARTLAERLVAVLAEPYDLGAGEAVGTVTTSIGVALFPDDGAGPDALLHNADTALYRAKWAGKNRVAFFHPEMDHELRERRAMEQDLHQAAARGQFTLAWQPLSSAGSDGQVTGFEVLLRWRHPERGLVSPNLFIPVAESCGAITGIGAWVLNEACREAASWPVPLRVAVNVSPVQAQQGDAFVEMVEQALASSGLPPARLILEVTEGVLIRDADRVLAVLNRLKALGILIALDDFGTGYSSLATLRTFPFDKIKIDRSFVSEIDAMPEGQSMAIVQAVLGLARGLGLPVVAEGVETDLQLKALRDAGCEEVQGWLIGRPAPIESFRHVTQAPAAASAA